MGFWLMAWEKLADVSISSEGDLVSSGTFTAKKNLKVIILSRAGGNEDVQNALSNTTILQADVTANDEIDQALLNELNVFGPPTIIFYDTNGIKKQGYEVVGYMKAQEFTKHVQAAIK